MRGDQDAPELLKSRGSREKTRTRVKRFTVVCERSETITSVRNVPKPRIEATAALPEPLPEADGRQQGVNKLTPQKGLAEMVETCRDCPECQAIKRGHQNGDTLQDANKC